jgi:tRNA G18 (ribose-2'-O)-methylase SpoU
MPIPMENNVESLNVSVSGAIAMYEWKRQQK